MPKLSRAKIAAYFASEIVADKPKVIQRLAALLIDQGRTRELDLVVADIEAELYRRGIVIADVTSALPLDEGFEEIVRQMLDAGPDGRVILREHVDPDLIGGIRVSAGGRELDATVRHRLNLLRAQKI